ncbi:hypothetical protein RJ639_001976 [Escallonia herrerae]|uniref:ASCH domain-containing protein n=1 Tax=Escallonia herrerae TaxID=1293975 RepID=A0AA89BNN8_9ASTE|nr:hypothetical protein RJ639_001976 [Escallonia herrerae]
MGSKSRISGNYRNPCLTMHQPWASLLVEGIKRIEGRSWPSPITGRLWIHAAGKIPDPETIKAMEDFYREIYAVNGITDIKFPEHYPISRLLVEPQQRSMYQEGDDFVDGVDVWVRLEGQTNYCWLCEQPQIYEAAGRGLSPVKAPLPVKFPLPDPRDPFSLKPGSLVSYRSGSGPSEAEKSPRLAAAIAGARAAATQFSKKNGSQSTAIKVQEMPVSTRTRNKSKLGTASPLNSEARGSDMNCI